VQGGRAAAAVDGRQGLAPLRHVVLFAGAALAEATAGRFRAAPHCVAKWPGAVRHSMVFELRAAAVKPAAATRDSAEVGAREAGAHASAGAVSGPRGAAAVGGAAAAVGISGSGLGDASVLETGAAVLRKRRRISEDASALLASNP
jgi:hypothetical protein